MMSLKSENRQLKRQIGQTADGEESKKGEEEDAAQENLAGGGEDELRRSVHLTVRSELPMRFRKGARGCRRV